MPDDYNYIVHFCKFQSAELVITKDSLRLTYYRVDNWTISSIEEQLWIEELALWRTYKEIHLRSTA